MYLLVVVACLASDPATCAPQELGVIPSRSAEACRIDSRPRVRAWDRVEEAFVLRSWSCVEQPPQDG